MLFFPSTRKLKDRAASVLEDGDIVHVAVHGKDESLDRGLVAIVVVDVGALKCGEQERLLRVVCQIPKDTARRALHI